MSTITRKEDDTTYNGLGKLLQRLYGLLDGVAIRCALELQIADIMNNHDGPITLSQIANKIPSPSLNMVGLSRLMMFLVHRQMFDQVHPPEGDEPLYCLNMCSKWLLHDSKTTVAPLAMMITESYMFSHFFNLNKSITEGGTAVKKTFGLELWDLFSVNPQVNRVFNEGMVCRTRITMDAIMSNYDFSDCKGTLVDVGGGLGAAISEIVSTYPHIKGINFDMPHVISTAPAYEGVIHVEGDMFNGIPTADSIFLKSILHNWGDDECIKILKNCRNAMSRETGKVIIVDIVLHSGDGDVFEDIRIAHDLVMLSCFEHGKERSAMEWKKILEEAGFSRYNVIHIPTVESIVEAYSD